MAEAAVLTVFTKVLVSNLLEKVLDEAKTVIYFRREIISLRTQLSTVQMLLTDALRRPTRRQEIDLPNEVIMPRSLTNWLARLQSTLEDAEDIVDECNDIDTKFNLKFRHRMGKRILHVKNRISKLEVEASSIGLVYQRNMEEEIQGLRSEIRSVLLATAASGTSLSRVRIQAISEKCIVGKDTNFKILQNHLLRSAVTTRIIGVVAMGGMGKTLLVKTVNNSKQVQELFERGLMIWLTVSQTCCIKKLQALICRQIDIDLGPDFTEEEANSEIFSCLHKKKFLLVLDDVWEGCNQRLLERLGVPLSSRNDSKIIVTTRDDGVLREIGAAHVIRMELLSPEESWELFCVHAFAAYNNLSPSGIQEIAMAIANECKGLPLAIKVIGSAMAREKNDPQQWKLALKQLKDADSAFYHTRPNAKEELLKRLRLSYDALPMYIKPCFIYCAAYAEDQDIEVEDLIQLWIGEGLVRTKQCSDSYDVGRHYLNLLIDRCLIEVSKTVWDERVQECRMHDVIRDLALHIAREEEKCLFRASQSLAEFPSNESVNCGRISLMYNDIKSLPESIGCQSLSSFLLRDNERLKFIPKTLIQSLASLRVLDLSWTSITELPETLGCLTRLVCLRVSRTMIKQLPASIIDLKKLELLDVSWCGQLECLPLGIGDLKNMKHLNLNGCEVLQFLPRCISRLTLLESLQISGCWKLVWEQEGSMLEMPRYCFSTSIRGLCLTDISALTQLRRLDLQCSTVRFIPSGVMACFLQMRTLILGMSDLEFLPEDMKVMAALEDLRLEGCKKLRTLPWWITSLINLKCLRLLECDSLSDLPPLERMPRLWQLWIGHCVGLKELHSAFGYVDAFPSLEDLRLTGLRVARMPPLKKGAMPVLKELRVTDCPRLKKEIEGVENLRSLRVLDVRGCSENANRTSVDDASYAQILRDLLGPQVKVTTASPQWAWQFM